MKITHITKILIDGVKRIEAEPAAGHEEEFGFVNRSITITDMSGDVYEITLGAAAKENLAIVEKPEDDWLTPQVYKGADASEDAQNQEA